MFRVLKAAGVLTAPVAYSLGRTLGNTRLAALSARLDTDYLRGYQQYSMCHGRPTTIAGNFANAAKLCSLVKSDGDILVKELFSKAHSQWLQDIVCVLAHRAKRDGYFVEVGVGNGTDLSNTLLLERDFGWRGILAEPCRRFHDDIQRTRNAVMDKRAVYAITGSTMQLEENRAVGELSGLSGHRTAHANHQISKYDVETVTLDDLLAEHNAPSCIDYVSIDTEGSELEILKSLDLTTRNVGVFAIEHNHDQSKLNALRSILLPAGYREILSEVSMVDAWFIHRDLKQPYL